MTIENKIQQQIRTSDELGKLLEEMRADGMAFNNTPEGQFINEQLEIMRKRFEKKIEAEQPIRDKYTKQLLLLEQKYQEMLDKWNTAFAEYNQLREEEIRSYEAKIAGNVTPDEYDVIYEEHVLALKNLYLNFTKENPPVTRAIQAIERQAILDAENAEITKLNKEE